MLIQAVEPVWGKNYKIGYVGFTHRTDELIENGIAYFTRWSRLSDIKVSHCFIVAGPNSRIEATREGGVAHDDLYSLFDDPHTQVFFRKPAGYSEDIGERIYEEASEHNGEEYDLSLIAAHALNGTFLGRFISLDEHVCALLNDPDEWVCSELCAHSLDSLPEYHNRGILAMPDETIVPQELFECPVIFEPWKTEELRRG